MSRYLPTLGLSSLLALGGCVAQAPVGPSVMALPPEGKSFDIFQQDEMVCRNYASQVSGGVDPAMAGQQAAIGSAVVGTALGAGVGAALGSLSGAAGAGAAVGGAAGLLMGSAMGSNNAYAAAGNAQQRYDNGYIQCMYSQGQRRAIRANRLCRGAVWRLCGPLLPTGRGQRDRRDRRRRLGRRLRLWPGLWGVWPRRLLPAGPLSSLVGY